MTVEELVHKIEPPLEDCLRFLANCQTLRHGCKISLQLDDLLQGLVTEKGFLAEGRHGAARTAGHSCHLVTSLKKLVQEGS